LGVLTMTGLVELWHVYLLALLLGFAATFDNPARQIFINELVPRDDLPNAIGLNSASFNGARLLGPAIAGGLVVVMGTGGVFLVNGATFAATIAVLIAIKPATLLSVPRAPRGKGNIRAGFAYLRGRADLVMVMLVMAVVSFFAIVFQITTGLMAKVEFGMEAGEFGLLSSILGIGSLAGALAAARRKQPRLRLWLGSAFLFGAALALSAAMPSYWTYALATIPVGYTSMTMMTAANTILQTTSDPAMRGRVISIYMMAFQGVTPYGATLIGWLGEPTVIGPRGTIWTGAIATMGAVVIAALWAIPNWNLRIRPHVHPRPHVEILTFDAAEESRWRTIGELNPPR
jgi:MFS family permease